MATSVLHHIDVRRTARVWTLGNPEIAEEVWYCLHGYGDLAGRHIGVFEPHAGHARAFVAPEALSRFYTDGTSGRIGASWMTREDRQADIADYAEYLHLVRMRLTGPESRTPRPREVVSGFSQGTATASRWVAASQLEFDTMILWGGTVAPDISGQGLERIRQIRRRILVFGDSDQYADETRVLREERSLRERGIPFELIRFVGGHRVDRETLAKLIRSPM